MAYAALLSLEQTLTQMLHGNLCCRIIPPNEEQEIETLHEKLSSLIAFLEECSQNNTERINHLEMRIRRAVYQAEDIIESHISRDKHDSKCKCCGIKKCFQHLKSALAPFRHRDEGYLKLRSPHHNIGKKYEDLEKAMEEIDSIAEEAMNVKKRSPGSQDLARIHSSNIGSSKLNPPGKQNEMVGFDRDLLEIKEQLCGESSQLEVIPILGMGGIGKTTLARNIFDDSLVAYQLHIRAWVTLSQNFDIRQVLVNLLLSMTTTNKNLAETPNDLLMQYVYQSLIGRRYLILIDDVSTEEAWDSIRRIFPHRNDGSRIVLTTRLSDIACYANSHGSFHKMPFLNEDQNWDLLKKIVFEQEASCPLELEKIGRVIANQCRGFPLAIVVLGGLLSKVRRKRYKFWKDVARDGSSFVATNDEQFSKILSLSYIHLPHHLKACFLHVGCFPKGLQLSVSQLIMVWVAEGFIKPPLDSNTLEEVAEEYLEDLLKRNLVLITKTASDGKYKSCIVHDLLRELCIQKAEEENFLRVIHGDENIIEEGTRRLNICSCYSTCLAITNTDHSPIRSVLCFLDDWRLFSLARGFILLRVLDAVKIILSHFPDEVLELFHLRYLVFSHGYFRECIVPSSISKLQNLETLCIRWEVSGTLYLPSTIWDMPKLRHLRLYHIDPLPIPLASKIGWISPVLRDLQTLEIVVNFKFTTWAIEMIPNLKKLTILYTIHSRAKWSKYCLYNLVLLHQLEILHINFSFQCG